MFAPIGYYSFDKVRQISRTWSVCLMLADEYAERGDDPIAAFRLENPTIDLLPSLKDSGWKFDDGQYERLMNSADALAACLHAKFLKTFPVSMCSPKGEMLLLPEVAKMHLDSLGGCPLSIFSGGRSMVREFIVRYSEEDLGYHHGRFLCISDETGLIKGPEMPAEFTENVSDAFIGEDGAERIFRGAVLPFQGWSVVLEERFLQGEPLEIIKGLKAFNAFEHDGFAGGNPRVHPKHQAAFDKFREMGFDRGEMSLKELINFIGVSTGVYPHESTYRSWERRFRDGFAS